MEYIFAQFLKLDSTNLLTFGGLFIGAIFILFFEKNKLKKEIFEQG